MVPHNKGKKMSEEQKRQISFTKRMKILSGNYNPPFKNKKHSEETRKKISLGLKGKSNHREGKNLSEETKKKISLKMISLKRTGSNSPHWLGGISRKNYGQDWTKTLRRSIRERDNYCCRICGKLQGDKNFDVHHIDYDKMNCNPNNLITLCRNCHIKTNHKRNYWINYFSKIMTSGSVRHL